MMRNFAQISARARQRGVSVITAVFLLLLMAVLAAAIANIVSTSHVNLAADIGGARAYQAARLVAKAINVRRALLSYDEKLKLNSPLAKKATYEIGGNYQAIAVYDQAADWYEKYAFADPKAEKADQALSDAVILRLGLGQPEKAIDDANQGKLPGMADDGEDAPKTDSDLYNRASGRDGGEPETAGRIGTRNGEHATAETGA